MILACLAAIALMIGASGLYLRSPNRALWNDRAPGAMTLALGWGGLVLALALLLAVMGPATAVFTWTTGLMFLWSLPPVAVRWLAYRRESAL